MEYLDFELLIAPGVDRSYPVSVLASPVGPVTGAMVLPFDSTQLAQVLAGLNDAVHVSARSTMRKINMGDEAPPTPPSVSEFGSQLFEALFAGDVQAAFRNSQFKARSEKKGLRVRLRVEAPDLAALPWEFLYDPKSGDYICLSSDTPLVRYLQIDRPVDALTVKPPIRILAMIASPSDKEQLDVAQERRRMEQATEELRAAGTLEIKWMEGSTYDALQNELRRAEYHIFHFVGHGGFDPVIGKGVLAFTDETGKAQILEAAVVARILSRENTLRLVVLNACLGAKGSGTDVFSSTAATLVRGGVPAVVGMQYEISDAAAIEFSKSLYRAIADGMPVDAAVADARVSVSASKRDSIEWGTPVLHMLSSDGVLFNIEGPTAPAPVAMAVSPATPVVAASATPMQQAVPVTQPVMSATPPVSGTIPAVKVGLSNSTKIVISAVVVGVLAIIGFLSSTKLREKREKLAAAAGDSGIWLVGFKSVQGPFLQVERIEATCRWMMFAADTTDSSFVDLVQLASSAAEIELFSRELNLTLLLPKGGGWVTADSGKGGGMVNVGSRVAVAREKAPAVLPECESVVFE